MKLHDLQVGQRFTFVDKHRCKTFEVTQRAPRAVHYADTVTGDERMATDSAKAFRTEVELDHPVEQSYPGMEYQPLFDHMQDEHGLILLQSELDDIVRICKSLEV